MFTMQRHYICSIYQERCIDCCGLTGQETDRFFVGLGAAVLSWDKTAVPSFGRAGCEPGLPAPGWSGVVADVDAWRWAQPTGGCPPKAKDTRAGDEHAQGRSD